MLLSKKAEQSRWFIISAVVGEEVNQFMLARTIEIRDQSKNDCGTDKIERPIKDK
jgi:hypothetical protein